MKFINKLERKLGKYAIQNLMLYILVLYALGYVLLLANPAVYYNYLALDASKILQGQVWRIVTFLIYPPSTSLIYLFLYLWLYYTLGRMLEYAWGAFLFNVYFFTGVIFQVIAAIVIYLVSGQVLFMSTHYLNLSLFLAMAATYPDMQFLLFLIIPVKAKWLGILDGVLLAVEFFLGGWSTKVMILLALANFLIFFFLIKNRNRISPREIHRKVVYKQQTQAAEASKNRPRHRCAVCGRTEFDDPGLEFRFCSRCEGAFEYCSDHLYTHIHVKKDGGDSRQDA